MFFETIRDNELYFSDGDNYCLAHFHRAVEIMYVITGTKTVFLDGKRHELQAGEVLFCPPYLVHQFTASENSSQYVVTATTKYCEKFDSFCQNKVPETYIIKDENGKIADLIAQLQTPQNEILFTGIINHLLGIFVDRVKFLPAKGSGEKSLTYQIAEYIENNYSENITLAYISDQYNEVCLAALAKARSTGSAEEIIPISIVSGLPKRESSLTITALMFGFSMSFKTC